MKQIIAQWFKKGKKNLFIDILYDFLGCLIFSTGVQAFSAPLDLPPGGVTGFAIIANHLTGLPVSLLTFLINLPLLVLAFVFLGKQVALYSVKSVLILTFTLELTHRIVPAYEGDVLLAALFAGVLQGTGLAIILLRGSTTGGTDIIARLIQLRFPHFPIGRLLFALDGVVLVLTAIVYRSASNAMYALVLVFISSRVIDGIVYGSESGRMLMIISEKHEEIAEAIHEEMERGSTLLKGVGTYTYQERPVLLCAISTPEFQTLKKLIHTYDPEAFVISLQTDEVLGEGFAPLTVGKEK